MRICLKLVLITFPLLFILMKPTIFVALLFGAGCILLYINLLFTIVGVINYLFARKK